MLQRLLAFGPSGLVLLQGLWIGPRFDRFVLPAFDGHVYAAMAESPRFFTLAPWGYRILEPWLVFLLPFSSAAVGFFWLNLTALTATVFATGWWLRRLGFSEVAAALAATAFAISPPMRLLLDYQVLVDPLSLLLMVLVFCALLKPDVIVLMALFALAALSKETGLLVLTIVPFHLVARGRTLRGLIDSAVVAAPAVALTVLLRVSWGHPESPPSSFSILDVTFGRAISSSLALTSAAIMSGLILPAFAGLFREASWVLRIQGSLLWLLTFALILSNPYHYSVKDLPRLAIFAWPALLPLALAGLGFRRTRIEEAPFRRARWHVPASVVALILCLSLVAATDRYDRAPFPTIPDPVAMVGRIRESIKTATLLEAGETFAVDLRSGRFAGPIKERFNLTEGRKQRWFLYEGFGPQASFESGTPSFHGRAALLLPILVPRTARLAIEFAGPPSGAVTVSVGGRDIGLVPVGPSGGTLAVPASLLVRGDNILRLQGSDPGLRLIRFDVRLDAPPAR